MDSVHVRVHKFLKNSCFTATKTLINPNKNPKWCRTLSYTYSVSRPVDITAGGDFLGFCDQKSSYKHVSDFGRVRSYGHFFNSRTRPRVNRVVRWQLAGDVLNFVAYLLRCKHYFCNLTRPPSNREFSLRISKLWWYMRNAGKMGWAGIRLASVYCMTQLLLSVQKPASHYSDCASSWFSEQYDNTECFKKSFTTLKAYRNLYRGHRTTFWTVKM